MARLTDEDDKEEKAVIWGELELNGRNRAFIDRSFKEALHCWHGSETRARNSELKTRAIVGPEQNRPFQQAPQRLRPASSDRSFVDKVENRIDTTPFRETLLMYTPFLTGSTKTSVDVDSKMMMICMCVGVPFQRSGGGVLHAWNRNGLQSNRYINRMHTVD